MNRLTKLETLKIRPDEGLSIHYRGKTFQGVEGDTIATALYANGVRVFARSLKYHRPRGLYSLDGECSNTLMSVDGVPNVRAENTPARNGMQVMVQNVKGGNPEFDPMGFMDKLGWAMPAGFYYRLFHKPAKIWPHAARMIRKAAGLGSISSDFQLNGSFDEIYPCTDVCIIGGGPAGMSAALAAAKQNLRVILLENRPWLGGFFDYRPAEFDRGIPMYQRARDLANQVQEDSNIRVFVHTAMVGTYSNNLVTAFQRGGATDSFDERYIEIRAGSVVTATGCIERPLLFENNERPGVMQVGCAHRLARTYGVLPGVTAVFSVGDDLGLEAAIDLSDLGMTALCVADLREDGQNPALENELFRRNIPLFKGWVATRAHGRNTLTQVTLGNVNGLQKQTFGCDVLVASAGLTPVTGPLLLAQAGMRYDSVTGFFLADRLPDKMHAAGRMLGLNHPHAIEASGTLAGLQAAADCGVDAGDALKAVQEELADLPGTVRFSKLAATPAKGNKTFICFDEDVTLHNVDQAMAAGFDVPELIKRYSSAGTGPGQGGVPGHNLALYVRQSQQSLHVDTRPTTVRPPLVPTYLATYAGANHSICKRTPLHDLQIAEDGRMETVGDWRRARRFSGDVHCREEIENVRTNVGMLDASTLGKFRLFGPDALKALQRVYISDMSRITDGKAKYSAMCNEDGCLIDDGVIIQTSANDYYFTTSTGRAGVTAEWIRYHTRFDNWDFSIVNLTDAYGVINIAGPNARAVLSTVTEAAVDNQAFPYMGYRKIEVGGVAVRALRLGFVGELSYELHVPSSWTPYVWELLMEAGRKSGIRNFGLEAQNALRLDKAHIIIGSESEQRTTLHDLGLGFLWYRHKPEAKTVGDAALRHTEKQPGRLKLVGFKMEEPSGSAPRDGSAIVDQRIRGYVCTARSSVALQEVVGLALVDDELAPEGNRLAIYEDGCQGQLVYARVVKKPFYDPTGERLRS